MYKKSDYIMLIIHACIFTILVLIFCPYIKRLQASVGPSAGYLVIALFLAPPFITWFVKLIVKKFRI